MTHVFNGMPPLHHRAPGPVAACLAQAARGEAVLEVIGDGVHLDAATVRMLFDLVGADGIAWSPTRWPRAACPRAATPSAAATWWWPAAPPGSRTAAPSPAASRPCSRWSRWCVLEAGVPLRDAVRAASLTPARALGLPDVGALRAGLRADVLVVDDDLRLRSVLRAGHRLG